MIVPEKCNNMATEMNLDVPYHHQKNCYFCGPTCLKIVFENFGVKKTESEIARVAGTTEKAGTSHDGMIGACNSAGFSCFVHENAGLETVKAFLRLKLPVVADWTDEKGKVGHYTIITEIGRKKIFFCDPWYGPSHAVDKKIFERYWEDGLTGGRGWMMVILPAGSKIRQKMEIGIGIRGKNVLVRAGRIYKP